MSPRTFSFRPSNELPARDVHEAFNGKQPSPVPLLDVKHKLNPPIVTIFGAGVAGLTAAHELVERGLLVQVVEREEDPYTPGRARVGGMAASQYARVRPNIEDIHQKLFAASAMAPDDKTKIVVAWLLRLFAYNRIRWIQTEQPARLHTCLFSKPTKLTPKGQTILEALEADLTAARGQYRQRWIWDLIIRSAVIDDVMGLKNENRPQRIQSAMRLYDELLKQETLEIASKLAEYERAGSEGSEALQKDVPNDLSGFAEVVTAAFEREFLSFRLVPYCREGMPGAVQRARALLSVWAKTLESSRWQPNCLTTTETINSEAVRLVRTGPANPDAWLVLEVIEQRLPGEHGYRFFPSSYRHMDETMSRIPLIEDGATTARTVLDNLKPTITQGLGITTDELRRSGETKAAKVARHAAGRHNNPHSDPNARSIVVKIRRDRPRSIKGLRDRTDSFVRRLGGTPRDAILFFAKMVRFMTSSAERRRKLYEKTTWKKFVELGQFSKAMQDQLGAASQVLLAFSLAEADTRTYGDTATQLLLDQMQDGAHTNRTLNGPTSEAWLEPWRQYLELQGVRFFQGAVKELVMTNGELVPVVDEAAKRSRSQDGYKLLTHEGPRGHQPDFYVLALDLGATRNLINAVPSTETDAPDFVCLQKHGDALEESLKDMTGVQLFFDAKTSIGEGHVYYPLAPWGLSAISQSEFWARRAGFSDGYMGVLSVDIADTGQVEDKGSFWQTLAEGTAVVDDAYGRWLVTERVWREISSRTGTEHQISTPRYFHVDEGIAYQIEEGKPPRQTNRSRFLAATPHSWQHRPGRNGDAGAKVEVAYGLNHGRWLLAGTFMATYTRMTTMEAANESGRHAARRILTELGRDDAKAPRIVQYGEDSYQIRTGENKTYNGASGERVFDLPLISDPERNELEDLEALRRIDGRLFARDPEWPHFMDVIDFDKKLRLALDAAEIYGDASQLAKFLPLTISTIEEVAGEHGAGDEPKSVIAKGLNAVFEAFQQPAVKAQIKIIKDELTRLGDQKDQEKEW